MTACYSYFIGLVLELQAVVRTRISLAEFEDYNKLKQEWVYDAVPLNCKRNAFFLFTSFIKTFNYFPIGYEALRTVELVWKHSNSTRRN